MKQKSRLRSEIQTSRLNHESQILKFKRIIQLCLSHSQRPIYIYCEEDRGKWGEFWVEDDGLVRSTCVQVINLGNFVGNNVRS